jgi:hypothetical protein
MDELDNALAWFRAAPGRLYDRTARRGQATAQRPWEVIQGDFHEQPSTAQTLTGTVISMIPLVDQLCDVRDIAANCRKIKQDADDKWAWLALALTLIGLFPTLGSLVKGCLKILFAYGRKGIFSSSKAALNSNVWLATMPFVEAGVHKLGDFLARPEVRKTLSVLKIDNPYKYLAEQLRQVAAQVNVGKLRSAFDSAIGALRSLLGKVQQWGPVGLWEPASRLIELIMQVRQQADDVLAQIMAPLQGWMNRLPQQLDAEHRLNYPASTMTINRHQFSRMSLDAEIEVLRKSVPGYVNVAERGTYPPMRKPPSVPLGHPDIGLDAKPPLTDAFGTSHTAHPNVLAPGTRIYRVLDPKSNDKSICWMAEAEYKLLWSKAHWRDRFAVWGNWNANGEAVSYVVPPGQGCPCGAARPPHSLCATTKEASCRPTARDKPSGSKAAPNNWW